ncbi:putative cytochrome P450 [Rosellinia necatrix]|uniref:Putative cytochrome P450 n=1 Tax=Rosellinia necatrix TaxID=77044 RepID=A0A1S8ABL0_ROSNE|nr:putative cytochrome P450 [Rosellinia necatrix]
MSHMSIAAATATAVAAYLIAGFIYAAFHPLRSFPGPLLWRGTRLAKRYHFLRGDMPFAVYDLHPRYRPVVRITPGEIAFADAQAFKDVYNQGLVKWKGMYGFKPEYMQDLATVSETAHHTFMRRHLAAGFSKTALHKQEGVLVGHVDLLIHQLREHSAGGRVPQGVRNWFNWLTFGVTGKLSFGADFGGLRQAKSAERVVTLTENARVLMWTSALPGLVVATHEQKPRDMPRERMCRKGTHYDHYIIDGLIDIDDPWVESNAIMLIMAGSETTLTALTATLYALLQAPEKMARLTKELRSRFGRSADIAITSTYELPYLVACLSESLRRYSPSLSDLARVVPSKGWCCHLQQHFRFKRIIGWRFYAPI